jgi:serine/threonine protein kinase
MMSACYCTSCTGPPPSTDPFLHQKIFTTRGGWTFTVVAKIGGGKNGKVYKICDDKTGNRYAAKAVAFDWSTQQIASTEANTALDLTGKSNTFCKTYCYEFYKLQNQGYVFTIMEFCESNLSSALKNGVLPRRDVWAWTRQFLEALAWMKVSGIIHRDIKPDNILIGNDGRIRLADFGIALHNNTCNYEATYGVGSGINFAQCTGDKGTMLFMAPEVFNQQPHQKADIFSFGMVVLTMIERQTIWDESLNTDLFGVLYNGSFVGLAMWNSTPFMMDNLFQSELWNARGYGRIKAMVKEMIHPNCAKRATIDWLKDFWETYSQPQYVVD